MKKLLLLLIICLNTSVVLASSDWDAMIWDQDNWYKGQSIINGQVVTHATGKKTGIINAQISIVELGKHVQSDVNGDFTFIDIPDGSYTIKIDTDYFASLTLQDVIIKDGEANLSEIDLFEQKDRYSQTDVDTFLDDERKKWDVDHDGKIGLKEAIKALSISAGFV
ncbi:conserved hypothetical protein, secreted, partial [Candidatus Magnetomorum sp. HK-1]